MNNNFRSGFEKTVYEFAINKRKKLDFEPQDAHVSYVKTSKYIPDFRLPNGILIECKGRFTATDRRKMLLVREQNPNLDIRFVFQRADNRLTKRKTSITYWQWAEKNGFLWSEGTIPLEWWNRG